MKTLLLFFIREIDDTNIFERLIKECCASNCLNAMYYNAIHLGNIDKSFKKSISFYQQAADQGYLNSLIRLIYLL